MPVKQQILNLMIRTPILGGPVREMKLRRSYPVEWALLNKRHSTSSTHTSIFHFSVNKAATQYVKSLLDRAGSENGLTPVNLNGYSFNSNLPYIDGMSPEQLHEYEYLFQDQGYVYSVFGGAIQGLPMMDRCRVVLMMRDPRDVLTSMYYSSAYSHPVPSVTGNKRDAFVKNRARSLEIGVDQFVLENAERERGIYQRYIDTLMRDLPSLYVTRFEDMTADYDAWLDALLDYCGFEISTELREALCNEAAKIRPSKENIHAHIRKGQPGDYLEKLKPETITQLNEILGTEVLEKFGYA